MIDQESTFGLAVHIATSSDVRRPLTQIFVRGICPGHFCCHNDYQDLDDEDNAEEEADMDRQKFLMEEDEKQELITALKKKWEVTHREYQTMTHKSKLDTIGMKDKFENCERELKQLEMDISKLSKNYIFVDTTQPSTFF